MHRRETQQGNRRYVELVDGIARILAFEPAQWIRFTSDNVAPNTPGGPLGAAVDLSPNARDVSQLTGTAQPLFANPGATFDGTGDFMVSASAFLHGRAGFSMFIVAQLTGASLSSITYPYGIDSGANVLYWDFGGAASKPRIVVADGVGFRTASGPNDRSGTSGTFLFDTRVVLGASGSAQVWENGAAGSETTGAWGVSTVANVAPAIGGTAAGTRLFPGTILDTLVFTSALSLAEQTEVRALLAQLDGVTL